jgi:urate oxidase
MGRPLRGGPAKLASGNARFSPSVQATLYEMCSAVLDSEQVVEEISLSMPNLHRNLLDLSPFELDNPNVLFVPTDEPHGSISASVCREREKE